MARNCLEWFIHAALLTLLISAATSQAANVDLSKISANVDLSTTLMCLATGKKSTEQSIPIDPWRLNLGPHTYSMPTMRSHICC